MSTYLFLSVVNINGVSLNRKRKHAINTLKNKLV